MNNLATFRESFNPWRDLVDLQREVSKLFDDFGMSQKKNREHLMAYTPTCDIHETESHFLMSFDLPGVAKKDIKIEIIDNQLMISGAREQENKGELGARHILERSYGEFQRSFTLPSAIESDRIEASHENGVLRLVIPKAEAARPKRIEVQDGKEGIFNKLTESSKESAGLQTKKSDGKKLDRVAS